MLVAYTGYCFCLNGCCASWCCWLGWLLACCGWLLFLLVWVLFGVVWINSVVYFLELVFVSIVLLVWVYCCCLIVGELFGV